jgi:hypothetical protein
MHSGHSRSMNLVKRFWIALGFALTLLGVFWVPKNLEDSHEAATAWQRLFAMVDQNGALWVFSIAALLYIFWIDVRPYVLKRKKRRGLAKRLDDFRDEGVRLRNDINKGENDLTSEECEVAREALSKWSDKALAAMDSEIVPVASASSFRTLDRFQPSAAIPNSPNRSWIVSMWNEKLTRLKSIIDEIEG